MAHRLVQAGFDNQFLDIEFFLGEDGDVRLQEVNARLATLQVPGFLCVMTPDPIEALLDILRGEQPRVVEFTGKHSSSAYLFTFESGKVSDIIDVELAKSMEHLAFHVKPEQEIKVASDTGTLLGCTVLLGDSREEVLKKHKELCASLFKKDPYKLGY